MSKLRDPAMFYGNDELRHFGGEPIPWVWDGLVVEEAITLLAAPEKTGKTTLLSLLLDRRRAGGQLLGRTVHPGQTYLCSEEHERLWQLRQPPLDFGPELEFHRPLQDYPTPRNWRRFIDHLCRLPSKQFDLVVIDTVMTFLPVAQNSPRPLCKALDALRRVAQRPAAVLLLHQMSSARGRSRARGPLTAFADIIIEMQMPPGDRHSRLRHFHGVSRYPGTLPSVAAELNPEGTDYVLVEDSPAPQAPLLPILQALLAGSTTPLTRQELLTRWPGDPPRPDTLWRTLSRGVEQGLFVVTGTGTKTDALRYELARQPS